MKLPAPSLAILAMVFVQLGAALSTKLFETLTPAGSTWMRLSFAAVILLVIARPSLRAIPRHALASTVALGAVTGLMMLLFIEAVARIPLGTVSAIEFLGPLSVAALRSRQRSALLWPALALLGVVGLTQPWRGELDALGFGFAAGAALGWAGYILLTEKVGAEVEGVQGLSLSLLTAAVVSSPFGAPAAVGGLTPEITVQALALAVLVPLLPFTLELFALRRMPVSAFGTLMALEPGIATVLGLIVLAQAPEPVQVLGVMLVVIAGIGAQRAAGRVSMSVPAPSEASSA